MAGLFFLLDLLALLLAGGAALVAVSRLGGVAACRIAVLAVALYAALFGVGLVLLPQLRWPVARTDNAFLGLFPLALLLLLFGLIMLLAGLRGIASAARPWRAAGTALALGLAGAALSLALLAGRSPEPWQTRPTSTFGADTFGFDVILGAVAIGALVFAAGRALTEHAPSRR